VLIKERLGDDPADRRRVILKPDQGRLERHAADKGAGAVDRINDPAPVLRALLFAMLFAQDSMPWIGRLNGEAEHPFCFLVGLQGLAMIGRSILILKGHTGFLPAPEEFTKR